MGDDGYLTLSEAANRAGYTDPTTLRQAVHRGSLRARKIGRDWITTEAWLRDYLAGRRTHRADARTEIVLDRVPMPPEAS